MNEQYIVSARKYRPDTFASIVGQGAMSTTLRAAVLGGRMAHAYLFCGPRGVGKTTAARVLAKTINCLDLSAEGEACNACESCRAFNEGRSFNIFELDAASNNSVEDIRSLTEQVLIAPVLGRYKVYIIDEVHMLSQSAFNAFLKTLEEPPSYAIFILATTEKHKILPTILSRCQTYDFKRITVVDIAKHLAYVAQSEGIVAEEQALGLIAEKADGGMRDALSMFDRVASYGQGKITYTETLECLNILDYNYYTRFIEGFVSGDYRGLLLTLDEVLRRGFDGQLVMSGLAAFARDLLVVQHAETLALLEKPQHIVELYAETARIVAPSALHQIIRLLVTADNQYRTATNKRLLIELTFLNILSAFQPNALESIAQQPSAQIPVRSVPTEAPRSHLSGVQGAGQVVQPSETPRTEPRQVVAPAPSPAKVEPTEGQSRTTHKPVTEVHSPTATPESGASTTAPNIVVPSHQIDNNETRKRFRNRKTQSKQVEEAEGLSEELHNSYVEADVQRAWVAYVEAEINDEHVFLKNVLSRTLPRLGQGDEVILPLIDTASVMDPIRLILPKIQTYIQRSVQNTDLYLSIEAIPPEQNHIPTSNREKYDALETHFPIIATLREQLELRII